MDILRRNTDYALRLMVNLARKKGNGSVSASTLASEEDVSYQLACKLMQKLHGAGLVASRMGPKGGFELTRPPSQISLLEMIEAIQGRMGLNRCLLSSAVCPRRDGCPVRVRLDKLQRNIKRRFESITLGQLSGGRRSHKAAANKVIRRKR